MYAERKTVTVTTDADGNGTGYTPIMTGRIINVIYNKDGTTPFADGVDVTVTLESTGQTVWQESNVNASKTVAPRQATHATDGTASLYAGAGEPVEDHIVVAGDRVKIVVAQGGNTKTGTFIAIVA